MKKLFVIFTSVVFAVVCMSISVFAAECDGRHSLDTTYSYETLVCELCGELLCVHCGEDETNCVCPEFDSQPCFLCGPMCECSRCGTCGYHADGFICRLCGLDVYDCTCESRYSECPHALWSDIYVDDDGCLTHEVCYHCGEVIYFPEKFPFMNDFFGFFSPKGTYIHHYATGKMSVHRGSLTYSLCPHLSMDGNVQGEPYLYIDQYGYVNAVCSVCDALVNGSFLFGDPRPVTGMTQEDLAVMSDYLMFAELFNFRIDSHDGFVTTRCNCGWLDTSSECPLARVNGRHEVYCPDCEGVYFGLFPIPYGSIEMYDCTGEDCAFCAELGVEKDIVPPPKLGTFPAFVNDTGSILSGGLDMVSTTAQTVANEPVLLLLYAVPFVALTIIFFRKAKR